MNNDQIKGKTEQVTGTVKQKVGEAIGNQDMANRGAADQVKGAVRETWGNAKEAVHDVHKEHTKEVEHQANDKREQFTDKVQDVKDRVNERIDAHKDQAKEQIKERRSA